MSRAVKPVQRHHPGLPAWMTWETRRLPRRNPHRICALRICRRTVCCYCYCDDRHDVAWSAAASGLYRVEGAGGRDETEGRAAPCTHPVPPLTCPRARLAVMYLCLVYRICIV